MHRVAIEVLQYETQSAQANQRVDVESEVPNEGKKLPTTPLLTIQHKGVDDPSSRCS